MYYPGSLVTDLRPRGTMQLRAIGMSISIGKLTATTFDKVYDGMLPRPASTSKIIRKGDWRGMRLYVLTLEELSTCPDSCALKVLPPIKPVMHRAKGSVCYGANMPFASRIDHRSPDLEAALLDDLTRLQHAHPKGFVVRLHELGDFFSTEYVQFWSEALDLFPALHLFGYSHCDGSIGDALDYAYERHPDRFRIMDSDGAHGSLVRPSALVDADPIPDHVTCPQQEARTPSCITCGLCMNGKTRIRFLPH